MKKNSTSTHQTKTGVWSPNRVELHPATDEWMRGDRYGDIIGYSALGKVIVRLDKSQRIVWLKKKDIYKYFMSE